MPTYTVDLISFAAGAIFGIILVFAITGAIHSMGSER